MLTPLVKDKVFTHDNYKPLNLELLQKYHNKIKLIQTCPDCKTVMSLNAFGIVVDSTDKPVTLILGCRECEKKFSSPLFF